MKFLTHKAASFLFLFFLMALSHTAFAAGSQGPAPDNVICTISGQAVLADGSLFPYGIVAFFRSSENQAPHDFGSTRRSPSGMTKIGEDGKFSARMPAGTYYVGAMMRKGQLGGPPRIGEARYSAVDKDGKYTFISVKNGETKEVGKIVFRVPSEFKELKDYFTIEGKILAPDGKGMGGASVIIKKDLNAQKPLYISERSLADGYYRLRLPPGKYFLYALENVTRMGRPQPGTMMGVLGQTEPVGIGGKSEQAPAFIEGVSEQVYKGVAILMFKIPSPEEKRKEIEAKVRAKEINKADLPANLPLRKRKAKDAIKSNFKPVKK